MNELWTQLEAWLAAHWPEGLAALNPPATAQEIAQLEAALGCQLPQDFVECLKVHNGQSQDLGLFDGTEYLSTQRILSEWTVWKQLLDGGDFAGIQSEPELGIRDDWWNAKWIPFTYNGAGDHLCLDLAPAEGGQTGQVISMWHDMAERGVEADSFEAWFRTYVDQVLAGEYVYSEDYAGIVPKDDV